MKIKYIGPYEFGSFPYVGVFRRGQVVVVDDEVGEILLRSHEFERVKDRPRSLKKISRAGGKDDTVEDSDEKQDSNDKQDTESKEVS